MRCEACHGLGYQRGEPCPDCGGCGVGHCCDGLQANEADEIAAPDEAEPTALQAVLDAADEDATYAKPRWFAWRKG